MGLDTCVNTAYPPISVRSDIRRITIPAVSTVFAIKSVFTILAIGAILSIKSVFTVLAVGAILSVKSVFTVLAVGAILSVKSVFTVLAVGAILSIDAVFSIAAFGNNVSKNSVTCFLINDDPFTGLWVDLRCQAILAVQTIGSIFAVLTVRAILAINTIFTIGSILSIDTVFAISAGITLIALGSSLASQILEEFLNGKIVQCDFISVRINHFASSGNRFLNVSFPHFVRALAVNSIFARNASVALISFITFIAFIAFVSFISLISFISFGSSISLVTFLSSVTFGFNSGVMIANPPVSILDIWDKPIRAIVSR